MCAMNAHEYLQHRRSGLSRRRAACASLFLRLISGRLISGIAATLMLGALSAQQTIEDFGEYRVIYGAVRSDALPEEVARRHGLPTNSDAVLLNVTVQRGGANVPATIEARAVNLAGQSRDVQMHETVANGLVSYIGVIEIAEREVLDFELSVVPEGAARAMRLEFREEFLPAPLGRGAESDILE